MATGSLAFGASSALPERLPISLEEQFDYALSRANGIRVNVSPCITNDQGNLIRLNTAFDANLGREAVGQDWPTFFKVAVKLYLSNHFLLEYLRSSNTNAPDEQVFKLNVAFADLRDISSFSYSYLSASCDLKLQKSGNDYIVPDSAIDMSLLTFDPLFDSIRVKSEAPISSAAWLGSVIFTNGEHGVGRVNIQVLETHDGGSLFEVPQSLFHQISGVTVRGEIQVTYSNGSYDYYATPDNKKLVVNGLQVRLVMVSDKLLQLFVHGPAPNGSMVIESSKNLTHWEEFWAPRPYNGMTMTDIGARGLQERLFYRVKVSTQTQQHNP